MNWTYLGVAAVALAILVVVKLYRKKIEEAGPIVIVPLIVVCLLGAGVAVYSFLPEAAEPVEGDDAGMMGGGPGGGRRSGRWALIGLVRRLPLLDQKDGCRLSREQAVALAPVLERLQKDEKLTGDQATATVESIKKVLTQDQADALESIEVPRRRRGGGEGRRGRGGPGGPGMPPAPGADPATQPQGGPGGPGGGGRGGRDPDLNPFQSERHKPVLAELVALVEARQSGTTPDGAATPGAASTAPKNDG